MNGLTILGLLAVGGVVWITLALAGPSSPAPYRPLDLTRAELNLRVVLAGVIAAVLAMATVVAIFAAGTMVAGR